MTGRPLAVAVVLGAALIAGAVAVAVHAGASGGEGGPAAHPTTVATGPGAQAAGPGQAGGAGSPGGDTPQEPGVFGRPSLSAGNPYDAFQGARPIPGVDLAATRQALTDTWGLSFTSRRMLGGVLWSGLGGDVSRHQRRLDAVYQTSDDGSAVFQVMCQAGGTSVTPTDDTSLRFVPDCVTGALHGGDATEAAAWLAANLRTVAERGGSTWVRLPTLRMYVESNRHVVSCVLTNG